MALRIMVACANGAGTSLMMKMAAERVAKSLNLNVQTIHHCALAEGKSAASGYDVVFVPLNFLDMFHHVQQKGVAVIGLRNVLSDAEMKEKLQATGLVEKNLL